LQTFLSKEFLEKTYLMRNLTNQVVLLLSLVWVVLIMLFTYPWVYEWVFKGTSSMGISFLESIINSSKQGSMLLVNLSVSVFYSFDLVISTRKIKKEDLMKLLTCAVPVSISCLIYIIANKTLHIRMFFYSSVFIIIMWIFLIIAFIFIKYMGCKIPKKDDIVISSDITNSQKQKLNTLKIIENDTINY